MDLKTLDLFVAVMETGSFSKAAQREHIAVSAVSKRLGDLERGLGSRLFQRRPDGIEPLPAAMALLRHARTVLRDLSQLRLDMAEFADGVRGSVSIAASTAIAANYLPEELRAFSLRQPGIVITVRDALSQEAVRMVTEGTVDLSIFAEPYVAEGLPTHPYKAERLVAVMPAGHPLESRASLTLEEMLPFDFVMGRPSSSLSTIIRRAAEAANLGFRSRVQVTGSETIARMVEAGHGVSVLPAAFARPRQATGVVARPLRDAWATRMLRLCFQPPETLTKPARLLAEHLAGCYRTVGLS